MTIQDTLSTINGEGMMVSINNTITMIGEGSCQSCTFPTTTTPKFYDPLVHHLLLREKDIQWPADGICIRALRGPFTPEEEKTGI